MPFYKYKFLHGLLLAISSSHFIYMAARTCNSLSYYILSGRGHSELLADWMKLDGNKYVQACNNLMVYIKVDQKLGASGPHKVEAAQRVLGLRHC